MGNIGQKKLGFWHNLDQKKLKNLEEKTYKRIEKNLFLKNLYKIGYNGVKKFKSK